MFDTVNYHTSTVKINIARATTPQILYNYGFSKDLYYSNISKLGRNVVVCINNGLANSANKQVIQMKLTVADQSNMLMQLKMHILYTCINYSYMHKKCKDLKHPLMNKHMQ